MQRDEKLAGRKFFTDAEVAEIEEAAVELRLAEIRARHGDAAFELWPELGSEPTEDHRTSLVVDPADGRIPPLTSTARRRQRRRERRFVAARSAEDRSLSERCIMWTPTPISTVYGNNFVHILQTPELVAIYHEVIHGVRIIPLDGGLHLPATVRQLRGDSRGSWRGNCSPACAASEGRSVAVD